MAVMKIGLVAHDGKKAELLEWCRYNKPVLLAHELCATGTTGSMIEEELQLSVKKLKSGPKGGDFQIGAMIVDDAIDVLIFFWDPLTAQPHDVDVKALLRLATMYNVPSACNVATADMIVSSPLFHESWYHAVKPDTEPRDYRGVVGESLDGS